MADHASRRGAANLGALLMVVTFLVIGGFLYWLSVQAEAERAADAVVEEGASMDTGDTSGATLVAGEDIQLDPSPYEGQTIRLEGLAVASPLGTQGFWLELPNGNPFLVSMSEGVKAEGIAVTPGQRANVVGTVHAMGDSVLEAWTSSGAVGEGDRLAAEFATHYLEATSVRVASSGAGGR